MEPAVMPSTTPAQASGGSAIDLRSDTVTRPSAAMRAAIAAAEVGDDVLGEDPTVERLQRRAAELLGHEAALFVPSGTMANQIALLLHCRHGDEVLVSRGAHTAYHEAGAAAAIAGVQLVAIGDDDSGVFSGDDVAAAAHVESRLGAPTTLVCVENTHNRGGGTVWPVSALEGVAAAARARGLALHLDGARIVNAAVATGVAPSALASPFDTVALAFSKGLGAPAGSVIAGRWTDIHRATRLRKMLGGAMRQAGVLAAAALWALEHNCQRIADDHRNARLLADRLAALPGLVVDPARVATNIVMVDLPAPLPSAAEMVSRLEARGVRTLAFGPRRLRLVTHLDVDRDACLEAAARFAEAVR
jgi:threonine aldolase